MQILKDYLLKAEDFLRKKNVDKPRLEAQLLFSHVLGLSRIHLYTSEDLPLKKDEVDQLRELLVEKGNGRPTAYITGKKEFFSLEFKVNNEVLIPRPETEELVELVLENEKDNQIPKLADLCTGSGCIAVALVKNLNVEQLIYSDISPGALEVAQANFETHIGSQGQPAQAIESDLTLNWPGELKTEIDVIVSNPPYVTSEEYGNLMPAVKNFEPQLALEVAEPEAFFKRMFAEVFDYLKAGGRFYFETNPHLIEQQKTYLEAQGFSEIKIIKDLAEKNRFMQAKK